MSAIAFILLAATSCSTGIESTKKIQMSRSQQKQMQKSEEQIFADGIKGTPLSQWKTGRKFLASSDRTPLIFEPSDIDYASEDTSFAGRTLTFTGTETRTTPDLRQECILLFSDGSHTFRYPTGKSSESAPSEIDSGKLPLLFDLALIDEWKERLSGLTIWTKSALWYDSDGNRRNGLKYAKATITEVRPNTGSFPMSVEITLPNGEKAYLSMNYTADTADSRNFAALFFLKDPKTRYPQITPENWTLIQQGKIGLGMTKEECRLALGNPDDVDAGSNPAQTLDLWKYGDGTYLMFTDGLLTRFRQ